MRFAIPVALALLCGCWPDSSGIDPPRDRLFFPTGLALAAGGDRLLVVNSNFDLRYNAGTVAAIRVRGGGPEGECCAGCEVRCVDTEIASCSGICRDARDESPFIAASETAVIGSGATDLAVSPDGRRAYVTVRGNGSLTYLDVDPDGIQRGGFLSCSADRSARRCDDAHAIVRTGDRRVPAEPYAVIADPEWVVVAHVTSGDVSFFRVRQGGPPTLERVVDSFPTGSNGLARHPVSGWYFMVSRDSRYVYPFTVSATEWPVGTGPAVTIGRAIPVDVNDEGSDSRFIAFSPAGDRAWITNRSPSTLIVVDVAGGTEGRVVDTIEIGSGPSRLAVVPLDDERYLVVVVCFDARELYVIDPVLRAPIAVLRTGTGPHAIAADPSARRVYLANFGESTVWVFDLEPAHASFGEAILKIGLPEKPRSND